MLGIGSFEDYTRLPRGAPGGVRARSSTPSSSTSRRSSATPRRGSTSRARWCRRMLERKPAGEPDARLVSGLRLRPGGLHHRHDARRGRWAGKRSASASRSTPPTSTRRRWRRRARPATRQGGGRCSARSGCERYFEPINGRYVFRSDLRRAVIFGRHDLMQDAPISRLDLLVCRNTLMYFNAETQARILGRFHFALNGDGKATARCSSAGPRCCSTHGQLFLPLDLKHRVFAKVVPPSRRAPIAPAADNGAGGDMTGNPRLRDQALEESPGRRASWSTRTACSRSPTPRARVHVQHQHQGPRPAAAGPRDLLPPGRAARAHRAGATPSAAP